MLVDFFFLFDEYVVPLPISFDSSWFSYWNGYTCILFLGYLCLECLSPCLFFPEVMLILVGYVCFLDAAIRWIMIFASILLVCVFLLLESKPLVLREIDDRWLLIPDFIFIVIVGAVVGCVCLYVSVIFSGIIVFISYVFMAELTFLGCFLSHTFSTPGCIDRYC